MDVLLLSLVRLLRYLVSNLYNHIVPCFVKRDLQGVLKCAGVKIFTPTDRDRHH
jgi:hypothetical protein